MRTTLLALMLFLFSAHAWAQSKIVASTTLPENGTPEHLYTAKNGNDLMLGISTAPTQNESNYALLAFYAADTDNTYYIYNYSAKKWFNYQQATNYDNKTNFVNLTADRKPQAVWHINNYASSFYQLAPIKSDGQVAGKYLNWYRGLDGNPYDGNTTLGLWEQNGTVDAGSRWTFSEVQKLEYSIALNGVDSIIIDGTALYDGDKFPYTGKLNKSQVSVANKDGYFPIIIVSSTTATISVSYIAALDMPRTEVYDFAEVYPRQQSGVGEANIDIADDNSTYILYNKVLAAAFVKVGDAIFFGGSEDMNLIGGSEPFTVSFGDGVEVNASEMRLIDLKAEPLSAEPEAIGGAKHFAGQSLVANYAYTYGDAELSIVWRAVLRDGSHYLRTEMELSADKDLDMHSIVPLLYDIDIRAAGSAPAVVGNTRGAVVMNNKIFAGVEHPVAYNTVGNASDDEDKWQLVQTLPVTNLTASSWAQVAQNDVPARVTEATGYSYPNIYAYRKANVALKEGQRVEISVNYKSGNHRLNFGGADLIDNSGAVTASDYHSGYSGNQASANTFIFIVPNDGTYTLRVMVENGSEIIDATSTLNVSIYELKPGVSLNTDIAHINGLWSRHTTLPSGEVWKISSVIGLIAQDGTESNSDIHSTQKRRSFLAYSERERAVPWRPFPCYISWYELNINRNNAADPTQNMQASQVIDVLQNWKTAFYDKYHVAPAAFVIDDGWDNYGLWTFHAGFPNEMRDMAALADEMGSGVGAWLGPVGGYGQSGNYRRAYWSNLGQNMVLGNPDYYQVFLDAARNLTLNQGTDSKGQSLYRFFKFDGISAQFSATGPDAGDAGNENAEGIIRLERYVRENLKEDIFFNTTVGTWASPFWYHFTDATWRQENDYGTIGNNSSDRENWITYRDRLVYQNYVTNSPICPINTLMTHGFILSSHGNVSSDRSYAAVRREMRCAFACGSGMVELYNDYALMNSINGGKLWGDLAECIEWQKRNADVLPDAHWVGGNPWNGSKASVYGWASWNGPKSTLALRNGATTPQTYETTLRKMLNIPANISGNITLTKAFADQSALSGLEEGTPVDIDAPLTLRLSASSVYVFDGADTDFDPTAVNSAITHEQATTPDTAIYDLYGHRLNAVPSQGIYIQGGRKIVVK